MLVALFREIRRWKDRAWPRRGARVDECILSILCLSRGPFCFCGDVGRYLRLAYRIGAPRALLYEGRRARYGGGGGLTSLQWHQATSIEVRFFWAKNQPGPTGVDYRPHTRRRLGDVPG